MNPQLDKSIMIYVQHLLGIGHLQRSVQLANALAEQGFAVGLVSGGMPVSGLRLKQVEFHQLPPLRSLDSEFKQLVDVNDNPVSENWKRQRCNQLLELFEHTSPDAVITETFPFGRRMMRFELLPLLEATQRRRKSPLVIASIRDILQPRSNPDRDRESLELVDNFYDRVLVHGDERMAKLSDTFSKANEISAKTCYSGYICEAMASSVARDIGNNEVLVSGGGGIVSLPLLRTAIAAKPLSKLNHKTWRLLVGHNISQADFDALRNAAGSGVIVERNRNDFPVLLSRSAVSVSQAGYNTSMDILKTGVRAVMVPFSEAGEREQSIRAELLHQQGQVIRLAQDDLSAPALADAINQAYEMPVQSLDLKMDGASESARLLQQWLQPGSPGNSVNPWENLHRELDLWGDQNRSAFFWWRDDDAVEETPSLRRLDELSRNLGVSVALATIPSRLQDSLADYLRGKDNFSVLQHGYSHDSFAEQGQKKIELGGTRKTTEIQADMTTGYEQMHRIFADQFVPVLVPPWNRIDKRSYAALVKAGFTGLSSMWARNSACPEAGLLEVNTHLDPVNWRADRGFIGEVHAIDTILRHLRARRTGLKDCEEPTGILTHHLAQDEAVWEFVEKLISVLIVHPAVKWLDAAGIWQKP
jgi:predicted glycosyltransferase